MNSNKPHASVRNLEQVILLAFIAKWCPYCLLARPAAEKTSQRTGHELHVVDVDEQPDLAREFGVETIPTLLLVRAGQVIGRWQAQSNPEDIPDFFANVCLANELQYVASS